MTDEQAALDALDALDAEPDTDAAAVPIQPLVEVPDVLRTPTSLLVGPAGTGKTFLAKGWAEQEEGVVLCATTGIAAVNLGTGTTINALLGYFDTASLVDQYTIGRLTRRLAQLSKVGVRRLLVDEISMLDAQQLTVLTRALDELAGAGDIIDVETRAAVKARDVAPIALTLVGDFAQLPPIKAPFAFESPEWPRYEAHRVTLETIRRQADRDFILALMAARRGEGQVVADYFAPRCATGLDPQFVGPTILAKNDAVARYNALKLDELTSPAKVFAPVRWGEQRSEWLKDIPDALTLKDGALVMLLANERVPADPLTLIYANGDLATVVGMNGKDVSVRLHRTGRVVTVSWVTRDMRRPLEAGRKKALKAQGREDLIVGSEEVVGTVTYLPLRLAWATTVHKAQGLSFDALQINLTDGFFKSPGMVYVGLSRCRTVDGLRLVGTPQLLKTRCTVHGKVKGWL